MHLSPAGQKIQYVSPWVVMTENLPAQHRHASADKHEPLGLAVLHQLPSAARRDAMLACYISPQTLTLVHTLVGQKGGMQV